ncbi:MAG: hypothetical protein WKF89_19990 [Chitinophagaceae bacterium]
MKALKLGLLAMSVIVSCSVASAQTADEVVAKHIDAIGGKEKIAMINSIYMENSFEVMGNQAPSKTTILNGKGFKNEVDFNGQKIVQCVTDKGGWSINPMSGSTTATQMPEEQLKAAQEQLNIGGPLFNYTEKGNKIELLGNEDIQGVIAFKLKVVTKSNVETTFFIDPKSYYVLKSVSKQNMNGQGMEATANFSDYKKTDYGYVVPFTTELQLPQFTIKSNTTKVEINKPVDENFFKEG